MVASKVQEILKKHKIPAEVKQCRTSEAKTASKDADLIVATTQIVDVSIPIINGIPFISGVGMEKAEQEIVQALQED
jgi:PTS system galactitol-specific IIB component